MVPTPWLSAIVAPVGSERITENESFYVNLSNPVGATIADGQGIGTITNDDAATPELSVNDLTVSEGNSGMTNATFVINLSAASSQMVTVQYSTADGSATTPPC